MGHIGRVGLKINLCNVLVRKREGSRSLDMTKRKLEHNIKIDIVVRTG